MSGEDIIVTDLPAPPTVPGDHRLGWSDVDDHIRKEIRIRRLTLGMSQKQLGSLVGLTAGAIGKFETGKGIPFAKTLYLLARALDCSVTDLYPKQRWVKARNTVNDEAEKE